MIVIRLENAPVGLRGDLTKWLLEIDSGVFVGQVNARVRDNLWERIIDNVKNGRAIMVYSTNNEQGLEFKVHGSQWEPIDFEGIKLMLRPSWSRLKNKQSIGYKPGESRIAKQLIAKRAIAKLSQQLSDETKVKQPVEFPSDYIVLDVETTGLNNDKDEIIEFGAIKVLSGKIAEEFGVFVKPTKPLSPAIIELTGITQDIIEEKGIELETALRNFLQFIGVLPCVAHNAGFDYGFIRAACAKCKVKIFANRQYDTLALAKKLIPNLHDRKLKTLAEYFELDESQFHRSIGDCAITMQVFEHLKGIK